MFLGSELFVDRMVSLPARSNLRCPLSSLRKFELSERVTPSTTAADDAELFLDCCRPLTIAPHPTSKKAIQGRTNINPSFTAIVSLQSNLFFRYAPIAGASGFTSGPK